MKNILGCLLACGLIFTANVYSAPGEFWELSSSMEGMGMSMPAQTSKECLPLKDDGAPAGVDKDCKITDFKRIPNGSTWKMSCSDGTTGSGKQTQTKDTLTSDILMNTEDGSMKMSLKGKRVGGSCDTGDKMKAMMAEMEKSCDLTNKKAQEVVMYASRYTTKGELCAGKKEPFCSMVKRDLSSDIGTFVVLNSHLKAEPKSNVVKACGLNVEAARLSLCKANASNRKEIGFLSSYCPSEAKAMRQKIRQEECSGRHFTAASDKEKCLAGMDSPGDDTESSADSSSSAGNSSSTTEENTGKSGNVATDAVKEGTKALKGLKDVFGF